MFSEGNFGKDFPVIIWIVIVFYLRGVVHDG